MEEEQIFNCDIQNNTAEFNASINPNKQFSGNVGERGPQGPQGIQGPQGPQGDAATIYVGLVETGAPGSNVEISNSGNEHQAILNFKIPQGTPGDVSDVKVDNVSVVSGGIANIDLSGKQDTLVSGTNIKTINGTSILGSGDIDTDQDLSGFADTDLSNITDTAKISMSAMSMPSETQIDLTLDVSGSTYTAPATGWVALTLTSDTASGNIWISSIDSNNNYSITSSNRANAANQGLDAYIPVKKNQSFEVGYQNCKAFGSDSWNRFVFIYSQGSESEAT